MTSSSFSIRFYIHFSKLQAQVKQLAGGLKEVKDVKAVTGMLSKTFGGKSDVKDVLGAVTVRSSEVIFLA